jgi:hypothetical protein
MAHFDQLWMFRTDQEGKPTMTVFVQLRPAGEVQLKVEIPPPLYDAIRDIAQKAADLHEAQVRAELLGERHAAA